MYINDKFEAYAASESCFPAGSLCSYTIESPIIIFYIVLISIKRDDIYSMFLLSHVNIQVHLCLYLSLVVQHGEITECLNDLVASFENGDNNSIYFLELLSEFIFKNE